MPQVRIIPLGFSAEPEPVQQNKPRDIAWSFMGTVWPGGSRARMLQAMLDVPGGFIHSTPHFGRGMIARATYRSLLGRTKFCPAPPGNRTWDTFRLYEGLEQGCLTMVERADGYYGRLLGEHAMIEIGDWREAAEAAQLLLADSGQFEARRAACHEWWRDYKSRLVQQIAGFVRARMTSR